MHPRVSSSQYLLVPLGGLVLIAISFVGLQPLKVDLLIDGIGRDNVLFNKPNILLPLALPMVFAPLFGAVIDRWGLRAALIVATAGACAASAGGIAAAIDLLSLAEQRIPACLYIACSASVAGLSVAGMYSLAGWGQPRLAACGYAVALAAAVGAGWIQFVDGGRYPPSTPGTMLGALAICLIGGGLLFAVGAQMRPYRSTLVQVLDGPTLRLIAIVALLGVTRNIAYDGPPSLGMPLPFGLESMEIAIAAVIGVAVGAVAAWEWREKALQRLLWFRAGLLLVLTIDIQFGLIQESATSLSPSVGEIAVRVLTSVHLGPAILFVICVRDRAIGIGAFCGWVYAADQFGWFVSEAITSSFRSDDNALYHPVPMIVATLLMAIAACLANPPKSARSGSMQSPR